MTYHPMDKARPVAVAAVTPQPVRVVPAFVDRDSVSNQLLAEHRCLSEVLYFEARGEGRQGQQAIAEVRVSPHEYRQLRPFDMCRGL